MTDLISVVIPTYDRPTQLAVCLGGLARSRFPPERFEVVVVDDGSPAPLDPVVEPLRSSLRLTLVRQPNRGPAAARNAGAAAARGELLAFTDDDCVPDPDWLEALARHAAQRPGHLIGGRTINMLPRNAFSAASQHLVSFLYDYGLASATSRPWTGFFASNNIALPTAAFQAIGGFDETFPLAAGEDRDFCARWNESGAPSHFAPDARIRHYHRLTLSRFWRQHWNYGRGAFHFHRARAERGGQPLRPEPPRFYLGMMRYPLRHEPLARGVIHSALLGFAQCANAMGFFHERRRARAAGP